MRKMILAISLCAGLAACGNNSSSGSNGSGSAAFTDTSSNTGGNTATPAKQNGDSTIDSIAYPSTRTPKLIRQNQKHQSRYHQCRQPLV